MRASPATLAVDQPTFFASISRAYPPRRCHLSSAPTCMPRQGSFRACGEIFAWPPLHSIVATNDIPPLQARSIRSSLQVPQRLRLRRQNDLLILDVSRATISSLGNISTRESDRTLHGHLPSNFCRISFIPLAPAAMAIGHVSRGPVTGDETGVSKFTTSCVPWLIIAVAAA